MGDSAIAAEDKTIVGEAMEAYRLSEEAFHNARKLSRDDLKFEAGYDEFGISTQWGDVNLDEWVRENGPALTLNQVSQFTNQAINRGRQQRPAIKVYPVDGGADPLTARALQGIVRSVEQNSHASVAYETGYEHMVKGGFGYWMLTAAQSYQNPKNEQEFDAQHIEIKRVRNPFTIFPDPSGEEIDGSDWNYCLIVEDMLREVFKRKYGESKLASIEDWQSEGNLPASWLDGKSCRVAEYYYAKHKKEKAYLLSNGKVVLKSILDANEKKYGDAGLEPGVTILRERNIEVRKIHWAKINAIEKLEETELPGVYIPIVPVYGSELVIDGKYILYGMVRNAKAVQQAMNYMVSSAVAAIGLAPKAPYMATAEQIEGYERIYEQINRKAFGVALYHPHVTKEGHLVPPPQRQAYEPAIQAFNQMFSQFIFSLKAATGLQGANLGEGIEGESGIARQGRAFQGETSTFHFQANWERAMWHTGRILLSWIPEYYSDQQVVDIIGEDNKPQQITLDKTVGEAPEDRMQAAQNNRYNIHAGRYDVTVAVGPGHATLRQERVSQASEILKTLAGMLPPPALMALMQILFRNMDLEGSEDILEELNKMNPPLPPQVQQQMQAMSQQIQMMGQALQAAQAREQAKTAELDSKEKIEAIKADLKATEIRATVAMKLGELESKEALKLLEGKLAIIQQNIEALRAPNETPTAAQTPEAELATVAGQ